MFSCRVMKSSIQMRMLVTFGPMRFERLVLRRQERLEITPISQANSRKKEGAVEQEIERNEHRKERRKAWDFGVYMGQYRWSAHFRGAFGGDIQTTTDGLR